MIETTVKETAPMTVAFATMRGPYGQIPTAMGQVYGFAGQSGLVPIGAPHGVYLTPPNAGPETEALWEVWAPVAADPPEAGPDGAGLGVKRVPSKLVASTMYKGPYEAIELTYRELMQWVADEGYELAGPPEEIYYSDPANTPPEEYLTEIQFPIRKL